MWFYDIYEHTLVSGVELLCRYKKGECIAYLTTSHTWGFGSCKKMETIFGLQMPHVCQLGWIKHRVIELLDAVSILKYRYVWIDWLCIDQINTEIQEKQIDMQGELYRYGDKCAILLEPQEYNVWCEFLILKNKVDIFELTVEQSKELQLKFAKVVNAKWFKSLWTLQEAHLSRRNVILSILRSEPIDNGLEQLIQFITIVSVFNNYNSNIYIKLIIEDATRAGLLSMISRTDLSLLIASMTRVTTYTGPRMRAIQHAFSVKLQNQLDMADIVACQKKLLKEQGLIAATFMATEYRIDNECWNIAKAGPLLMTPEIPMTREWNENEWDGRKIKLIQYNGAYIIEVENVRLLNRSEMSSCLMVLAMDGMGKITGRKAKNIIKHGNYFGIIVGKEYYMDSEKKSIMLLKRTKHDKKSLNYHACGYILIKKYIPGTLYQKIIIT